VEECNFCGYAVEVVPFSIDGHQSFVKRVAHGSR